MTKIKHKKKTRSLIEIDVITKEKPDIKKEYIQLLKKYTDVPDKFIIAGSYHLLSSLLGRFFETKAIPNPLRPGIGTRPNIWFILSSIPGRTRRSTILGYNKIIYKKVLLVILKDSKVVTDTILEEGTVEGISDQINYVIETNGNTFFDIMNSEIGPMFQRAIGSGYEKGIIGLLSKLFYGEGWKQFLSKRNKTELESVRRVPEELYVTMLSSMQEPDEYLDDTMIKQGFLRRVMIIYIQTKELSMDNWKPPIDESRIKMTPELENLIKKIINLYLKYKDIYDKKGKIQILFQPKIEDKINDFARELDKKLTGRDSQIIDIFQQSFWEHLVKLCMLESISRSDIKYTEGIATLEVTIDDYKIARNYIDEVLKMNLATVDRILTSKKDKIERNELNRVYNFIYSTGKSGIPHSSLYRKMNINAYRLKQIIEELERRKMIKINIVQKTRPGPTATIYIAKELV